MRMGGFLTYPIMGARGRSVSLATAGSCKNIPEVDCQSLTVPAHLRRHTDTQWPRHPDPPPPAYHPTGSRL